MKKIYTNKGKEIIVDDEDYSRLNRYDWELNNWGYAQTKISKKIYLMHRVITNAPKGMVVDHINRVRNDNRKENLRVVSQKENMQNVDKEKQRHNISVGKHKSSILKYMENSERGVRTWIP